MASPKNDGNLPKTCAPQSSGSVVRKIPSSLDSPAVHTGQYVVAGVAERISQTRIPEEHEPKWTGERKRLKRMSDQPTVMIAMPDGLIDLQDKEMKKVIKSSIGKTAATNQSTQLQKEGPGKTTAVKNDPSLKTKIGKTASQKDQLSRQLNQLQAQQMTLTRKQLIPTESKERASMVRESFCTDEKVSDNECSESPAVSNLINKNGGKKSFRCCSKKDHCSPKAKKKNHCCLLC